MVFEASWDLAGALTVQYHRSGARADVVTPSMRLEPAWLVTTLYDEIKLYPYRGLLLYDARRATLEPIGDVAAARRYFASYDPDLSGGCPPGRISHGVALF